MKKLDRLPLRRALISVYDKTNLVEFARGLHEAGVKLVSTGSTASTIAAAGVPVTEVTEVTEFPECLEGRVKTLHPRIHAGILADRRKQEHIDTLNELDVEPFDLVVVNLYPSQRPWHPVLTKTLLSRKLISAVPQWCVPPRRITMRSPSW